MSEAIGEEVVQRLMRHLVHIKAGSLSCADAFSLLDEYTDLAYSHEQAEQLMPLVHEHLELCPGCRDFYETLIHLLQLSEGVSRD
ncbi:MAG: hypothetical protein IPL78_35115 [Chloroflexi bacterium]|nr:hypothetical protein [Chloroflexota bacterium]